uniref:PIN domain-containing protein n=1 Tax=Candidatus Kentrum sp. FW TaxID=2126338 RepID=A0A450TXT4_9GAMM|nr:MAG: hypothetical protein BECKFW1821C_GA0114237_10603 [Candidatus Kentron sp. FW]
MKVYADTSVFGGVFDEEFAEDSRRFFYDPRVGRFIENPYHDQAIYSLISAALESSLYRFLVAMNNRGYDLKQVTNETKNYFGLYLPLPA